MEAQPFYTAKRERNVWLKISNLKNRLTKINCLLYNISSQTNGVLK